MKILIIDRDDSSAQLLKSTLEAIGHGVTLEKSKEKALASLKDNPTDIVFADPSPLKNAQPLVRDIRRAIDEYPYVFITSTDMEEEDAIKSGANTLINKPYDIQTIHSKLNNATSLRELVMHIGDTREDFPSAGGVIAKSAFNQLFLSAIDRAGRYGEKSYILFLNISNYDQITEQDGPYAADYASAQLSKKLVAVRRQSDIIGQTRKFEYALILFPGFATFEPDMACKRFANTMGEADPFNAEGSIKTEITVSLIEIPSGELLSEHVVTQ